MAHHRPTRTLRRIGLAASLLVGVAVVSDIAGSPVGAVADANMVPVVPARLLETRPGLPTVDGQHDGVGAVAAGTFYRLPVAGRGGVADDARAVMLNVTAVAPVAPGFLTVFPCTAEVPLASNVNYFAGQVRPNSVLAKLSDDGEVCVYSHETSDVIVDVTGYVPEGGSPVPVEPARLIETRVGPTERTIDRQFEGSGRVDAGETVSFVVTGRGGVPADVDAVYLNVTAIDPAGDGFLTVFPCGSDRPNASNVNYIARDVRPNAVLATVGDGGRVCIYTLAAVHVIADVNAYLPPGGNREPIQPVRCADTRPEGETFDGLFEAEGKIAAGGTYAIDIAGRCGVDADASAAYMNVTAVNPEDLGFLTVWPCDEPRPVASSVNYAPGEVNPNAVLSKVSLDGAGQICIYSLARTDVIVDVNGYVPEPGLFGVTDVSAGRRITCVLMSDTTVRCAGDGGYTGDGTFDDVFDPAPVVGLSGVEMLEAGESHACAVLTDGTVRCWGSNTNGRLGDGTDDGDNNSGFPRRVTPVPVVGLDGVIDISAFSSHNCAITDDDGDGRGDSVSCWGRNNNRQLGDGTSDDRFAPVAVQGLPAGKTPVEVAAGGGFSCVRYSDGTVWCWGQGGRVGRVTGGSASQAPAEVTDLADVVQLEAGGSHACARIGDGTVECWGLNEDSALGQRDAAVEGVLPAPVIGVSGAVGLTVGEDSTCVLLADGTGECWGDNGRGQLGRLFASNSEVAPAPMQTGRDADIVQVSGNGIHMCARLADSSVVCWGYYLNGNLGVRLSDDAVVPVVFGSGDLRS